MTYENVMNEVQEIFRDVTDNPSIVLKPETTSDDIEEWDSLTHIQLVVGIEKHFKISFTADEIGSYANVGEMCSGIEKKLNG
jgi:acyl carrier protein